jgi:iron complex outermembrane receptor protein
MKRTLLALAIAFALSITAAANGQDHDARATELDQVVVTASPMRHRAEDVVRPVEILAGTVLDDIRAATLGETVARLPGVQSSFFGAGVGRPIIRGLDGPRVQVLSEGLGTLDVSTVSVDHAVTVEPFLADQIEVLKGPATLLFGSGAVGGAVNVVDGRIHEERAEGISGRAEARGNTVADERAGMFRTDAGAGNFVFHVDSFHRETGDYDIPGFAELETGHDHDDDNHGEEAPLRSVLENSATRTRGGAVGISYIGDRGFAGVSLGRFESRYGVPGHEHEHEHEHEHADDHGDGGHGDDHGGEEHGNVVIDMKQTRIDIKAGLDQPMPGHESLRVRLARNDYRHVELEGDAIGTRFDNAGLEGRVELVHRAIAGWNGAYGVQFGRRDFEAVGDEAFVPPSVSSDLGLFLIERRQWDRLLLEVGGRFDRQSIDPDNALPARDIDAFSASVASEWRFSDRWHLRLGLDRAQRAPGAEELYSDGLHVATGSFEIGDSGLGRETSNQAELGLHYHGDPVELRLSTYLNRFEDFIYLADTGEEHDGVEVRRWQQSDARFRGAEAEIKVELADNTTGRYQARLLADTVRGTLTDDGGNLPRIAPGRFGGGVDWSLGNWRASLSALRYRSQDDVAEHETPTDGYTLIDADLAYAFEVGAAAMEVFVQGRNLGNDEARLHTSFLKSIAPLPGRSIGFGIRTFF